MTDFDPPVRIRPGPDAIDPSRAPGGIVIQVYDHTGALILERALSTGDDAQRHAEPDAELVADRMRYRGDVCMVVYDGDTGARMPIPFATLEDAARAFET
jgi:hypothetical protein